MRGSAERVLLPTTMGTIVDAVSYSRSTFVTIHCLSSKIRHPPPHKNRIHCQACGSPFLTERSQNTKSNRGLQGELLALEDHVEVDTPLHLRLGTDRGLDSTAGRLRSGRYQEAFSAVIILFVYQKARNIRKPSSIVGPKDLYPVSSSRG